MEILVWSVIGAVALALVAFVVYNAIKLFRMKPDERKALIVQFLLGLVDIAEIEFIGSDRGKEKIAWVEEQFNKTAPWFLKLVLTVTKTDTLQDLIEIALKKAKEIEWDKKYE